MTALISVYNKNNIVNFAKGLELLGIELVSTGGTYDLLSTSGLNVKNILDLTKYKTPIDSIIKTLYPEIYAGISVNRDDDKQMNQLNSASIDIIDIVIVNLFPFNSTINHYNSYTSIFETIDIGGPTILRSAAKNYKNIIVVSDPNDYDDILQELKSTNDISLQKREYLAQKVFKMTSDYDKMIYDYLLF